MASSSASLNPEIAQAVAAAAANKSAPGVQDQGPPPDGILPLSRANAEAPRGQPARLVLGSAGADPKLLLGGAAISDQPKGLIEVSVRLGQRSALPSTAFKIAVTREAREGETADVSLRVKEARLSKSQPGQFPPEVGGLLATLKGSEFNFKTDGGKAISFPDYKISKTGPKEMARLLSSTADAIGHLSAPLPAEPVGAGAFWMTTSRENFAGTDSVAYRMVKLAEVTAGRAVLEVETRRYAATDQLGLPNIESHKMLQFQSNDKGQMVFVPGNALPVEGQMEMGLGALLDVKGEQIPVQIQTRGLFSFAPKASD